MTGMLVINEGPDGIGKSILAKVIANVHPLEFKSGRSHA